MIQRVYQGLAQRHRRIGTPAARLDPLRLLAQVDRRPSVQILEAVAYLPRQPAAKLLLFLDVSGPARGEQRAIDPCAVKPAGRLGRKEQQTDIAGHVMVVDPCGDTHAMVDLHRVAFVGEPAADLVQMLPDGHLVQAGEPGGQRPAVVPRHRQLGRGQARRRRDGTPSRSATPMTT
ncbi:MAG: hypothetical protein OXC31_19650 [Spirochaetaceae bacterium]|nr:hypothetical protein [Spirochaetaceae bacterium]